MDIAKIVLASEDSLQIQFNQIICPEVNSKVSAFTERFELMTRDIPEVIEIVPTYCSVSIYFDEKNCKPSLLKEIALEVLEKMDGEENELSEVGKTITIPVCYEDEFAPDLEKVAAYTGLAKEEVVKLHSSTDYLIYMMGFLPGFPYLGGMDEALETPRLETPRTRIPAGSLAIGGKQTGLYPVESPGGWNIIGRTPLKLFDMKRKPFFLYKAGDKICFQPISKKEFESFDEELWLKRFFLKESHREPTGNTKTSDTTASSASAKKCFECSGGIKVLDPGLATTIQDNGIKGFQKYGISQSGVMDELSFARANKICGNPEKTACLETTLFGPKLRFINDCEFAISGGIFANASLDGVHVDMDKKIFAKAGSVLECGYVSKGLRSYIAFAGGIIVPEVFGSFSTNLKSKIGGMNGRKLESEDELAIGYIERKIDSNSNLLELSSIPEVKNPFFEENKSILILDCIKSSQFDLFSKKTEKAFLASVYTVSAESDRMGIRFEGQKLDCGKTDIISDSIPFGAIQITSAGLPLVMAADRQTTGGYAKIACVKKTSMCKLAQALPGTKVKFNIEDFK